MLQSASEQRVSIQEANCLGMSTITKTGSTAHKRTESFARGQGSKKGAGRVRGVCDDLLHPAFNASGVDGGNSLKVVASDF